MAIKTVVSYRTSDNDTFCTMEDAESHEEALEKTKIVEKTALKIKKLFEPEINAYLKDTTTEKGLPLEEEDFFEYMDRELYDEEEVKSYIDNFEEYVKRVGLLLRHYRLEEVIDIIKGDK